MSTTTALVLARPERRRILKQLIDTPEPWTLYQRKLYRDMLEAELHDCFVSGVGNFNEMMAEAIQQDRFCELMIEHPGMREDRARELAAKAATDYLADEKRKKKSGGQQERERRRTFREAVTHLQGGIAVTAGLVETCITCGGAFYPKRMRRSGQPRRVRQDAAYCSDACKQAAYRQRKRQKVTITEDQQKKIRELRELAAVVAKYGITRKQLNKWAQLSTIPAGEMDDLVRKVPDVDIASRVLALHQKRTNGAGA